MKSDKSFYRVLDPFGRLGVLLWVNLGDKFGLARALVRRGDVVAGVDPFSLEVEDRFGSNPSILVDGCYPVTIKLKRIR